MSKSRSALVSLALAALLVFFPSCSKEKRDDQAAQGARAGQGLLASELLAKIPPGSLGFFIWDTGTGAYRKFRQSPWGEQGLSSVLQTLNAQPESEAKELIRSIIGIITESGLVSSGDKNAEEPVRQGVGFVEYTGQSDLLAVGLYLAGRQGSDMQEKLDSLSKAFEKEGFALESKDDLGGTGVKGLIVKIPAKLSEEFPVENLYVAADRERLAMSSSEAHVKRPFGDVTDSGLDKLKASPDFTKTTSKLGSSAGQIALAYFDVNQMIASIEKASGEKSEPLELRSIPVGAVAFSHGMEETPSGVMAVTLNPKSEEQKTMLANLAAKGGNDLIAKSPASLLFYLGVDGNILVNAKNTVLTHTSPEEIEPFKALLDSVDSMKGLALGLKGAGAGSPFPEVLLMIQSSKTAALRDLLQQEIQGTVSGAGMPLAAWQQKEIDGAKVSYALTPLGIGLFLVDVGDKLAIASSESAVADFVAAAKGGSNLLGKLSAPSKSLVTEPTPLFSAYTNFEGLAGMMESMQGTLAMFTGGQSAIQNDSIEQWKKMGGVAVAMDHDAGVLRIRSGYEKPTGKTQQ